MKDFKAIVFDIDGTLTDNTSWTTLTEKLGASKEEHETIFKNFLENSITYEVAKAQLLTLWKNTGNANREFFHKLFTNWELKPEAPGIMEYLRSKNYILVLITGSVDLFASSIAHKLNIQDYFSNTELVWDVDGLLTDFHYDREQGRKKRTQFIQFCAKQKIEPKDCVIVGDSNNDIELFTLTGHGIAVLPAHDELRKVAWKEVSNLSQIKNLL